MSVLTRKIVKDMAQRKLRTILTIFGIALGVIGLSAISIASNQFKQSFQYSTDLTAQPDIQFYTNPTSSTFVDTLQTQPHVKVAQSQGDITTRWKLPGHPVLIKILAFEDLRHIKLNKFDLIEGHLPGANEIVLEKSTQSLSAVHIGDTINLQVNGKYQLVTVSGFTRTRGLPSASVTGKAQGYMAEQDFETLFQRQGVTNFVVQIDNYAQRYTIARTLSTFFEQQQIPILGMDIGHDASVTSIADGLFAVMNAISGIAILLSVILLLGTITSLITDQIRHIGTMKAIGAVRGQVMRHYLSMVFFYSLLGTVIGGAAGIWGGYFLAVYLGSLVNVEIGSLQIAPVQLAESMAIGLLVPLLAAFIPVYIATKITVRQALSGYGVDTGNDQSKSVWRGLARVLFFLFPQTIQFGIRGMFRKRTRAILTLITLTIASAAFLAVQTASYSFDHLLNQVYTTYHFDVRASIAQPQTLDRYRQLLGTVEEVDRIEQLSQDKVSTDWGDALLTGVQPDTRIYQRHLLTGRWFDVNEQDVVLISKDAADKSGLKIGDHVTFHTAASDASWRIIGIVNDLSGVGPGNFGVLLTSLQQVNLFNHRDADVSNTIMIQATSDHSAQKNAELAKRIDTVLSQAGFTADIITAQQQIDQDHNKYQVIYLLFDVVALVVGIVGAIGLSNSLTMSVLERRREIGILRAMGAVGGNVALVFWSEGLMLGVLAWLLAMILGFPAAYGFVLLQAKLLAPVPFAFDPLNLFWMLVAILILTVLASIGPVFGAMRMRLIQTLRYE